ncbi:MAG: hypothetical protein IH598_07835 [Bacteroidales bacterium]|nr:hypothetical protein [Bacteroidales bacterium]
MITTRKALLSVLIFIVVYTLLLIPQINVNKAYAELFCKLGNYLYRDFPRGGYVKLSIQSDRGKNDIALFLSRADWIKERKLTGVTTDKASDRIGYLITAFYVALVLSTPMSWKRKVVALVLGLVLMTAFVMLKVYIIILQSYTLVDWFDLYQEPAEKEKIQFWYSHFAAPATYGYSFAVILWLALSIGKKEWKQLNALMVAKISVKKGNSTSKTLTQRN